MFSNLHKGVLFLLLISTLGCDNNTKEQFQNDKNTANDILLNRALLNGYYFQPNQNLGVCFYDSNIYLLFNNKTMINKEFALLHFIKEDNTFENRDFKVSDFVLNDSLFNKFNNLQVVRARIINSDYKKIRIGVYYRLEDGSAQNKWVREIDKEKINKQNSFYQNEFFSEINQNLIQESFDLSLKFGTFFQNAYGFYILYDDDFIYLITDRIGVTENSVMLHFIDENNNFVNRSFSANHQNIGALLKMPYKNYIVTRMSLPDTPFIKVRIGQYNDEGNIWMQEFYPGEILKNPLLKYNNELSK